MKQHIVICKACGRKFNADWGGFYYKKERRYMCTSCHRKLTAEQKPQKKGFWEVVRDRRNDREARTAMRQSPIEIALKLIYGIGCLAAIPEFDEAGEAVIAILLGGGLIAWAVVPWLKARKIRAQWAEEAEIAEKETAEIKRTCPHCGGQTRGAICEYCGQPLDKQS